MVHLHYLTPRLRLITCAQNPMEIRIGLWAGAMKPFPSVIIQAYSLGLYLWQSRHTIRVDVKISSATLLMY